MKNFINMRLIIITLFFIILISIDGCTVKSSPPNYSIDGKWLVVNNIPFYPFFPEEDVRYSYDSCTNFNILITDSTIVFEDNGKCFDIINAKVKFKYIGTRNIKEDSMMWPQYRYYIYTKHNIEKVEVFQTNYKVDNCTTEREFLEIYQINEDELIIPFCDNDLIVLKRWKNSKPPMLEPYENQIIR